jgi:hypothetical protein
MPSRGAWVGSEMSSGLTRPRRELEIERARRLSCQIWHVSTVALHTVRRAHAKSGMVPPSTLDLQLWAGRDFPTLDLLHGAGMVPPRTPDHQLSAR